MQCAACHFENLPGLSACARCASPLVLDDIRVAPPRASPLRLRTRLSRALHTVAGRLPSPRPLVQALRRLKPEPIPWGAVASSIVPGLGLVRIGRRRAGAALLAAWAGLLVASAAQVGSATSSLCWWLAIGVHTGAVLALFGSNLVYTRLLTRVAFGLLVFGGLCVGVYRPLAGLASRFAVVMPVGALDAAPGAGTNDVLLVEGPWLRRGPLERGDLVLCAVPASRPGPVVVMAGHVVDRIVGIPGDVVVFDHGALRVNGQVPQGRERPLSDVAWPIDLEWRLGADEFLVFPSRVAQQFAGIPEGQENAVRDGLLEVCRVARREIAGRVFWRLRPWLRFGAVD